MAGPFKMKGFSGFGNSPLKQDTDEIAQYNKIFETRESRLEARKKLRGDKRRKKMRLKSGDISQAEYDKSMVINKRIRKDLRRAGESKLVKSIRKIFKKKDKK